MQAIEVNQLSKSYGSTIALNGISFSISQGEIFGLLGPNGAGKTTTINILLGLIEPSGGAASVYGFDVAAQGDKVRAHCGALLEYAGLYEQLTAEDNLRFYGLANLMSQEGIDRRIEEILKSIDLWDRRKDRIGTWSRGMRQKLALGRTIMHQPKVVFLDEPTAGLDVLASSAIRADLKSLSRRDGMTLFLTTHNMAEAEEMCDRVAVIRDGELVAIGPPDSLRARASLSALEVHGTGFTDQVLYALLDHPDVAGVETHNGYVAIRMVPDGEVPEVVKALVQAGVKVEEVRHGSASLEDVFLTLMEEA
jgi:ABC-2 type transport system ATP-binding protein